MLNGNLLLVCHCNVTATEPWVTIISILNHPLLILSFVLSHSIWRVLGFYVLNSKELFKLNSNVVWLKEEEPIYLKAVYHWIFRVQNRHLWAIWRFNQSKSTDLNHFDGFDRKKLWEKRRKTSMMKAIKRCTSVDGFFMQIEAFHASKDRIQFYFFLCKAGI